MLVVQLGFWYTITQEEEQMNTNMEGVRPVIPNILVYEDMQTKINFPVLTAYLNRALKPHKFGPEERMVFMEDFGDVWESLCKYGTQEQRDSFTKKFNKFCKMFDIPTYELPDVEAYSAPEVEELEESEETNFDKYLEDQLEDKEFVEKFEKAKEELENREQPGGSDE